MPAVVLSAGAEPFYEVGDASSSTCRLPLRVRDVFVALLLLPTLGYICQTPVGAKHETVGIAGMDHF